MNNNRLVQSITSLALAASLSACSMFGSKSSSSQAPVGAMEFDANSNSWQPATRVVVPTPSQPNAALAQQAEEQKRDNSVVKKAGRTVGKVGKTVSTPLKWIPFVGKKDAEQDPAYTPAEATEAN